MIEPPKSRDEAKRLRSSALDGLRGLAAASVLTLHFMSVFLGTSFLGYQQFNSIVSDLSHSPLEVLWGGSQAVMLFFILSGFALHRMLSSRPMNYRGYAARRLIRLWIPYATVLILASLGIFFFGSNTIPGQSLWMNSHLGTRLSIGMLAQHATMVGVFNTDPLDFVIWSLVLELRLSLVFPAIYWVVERFRPWTVLAVSFGVSAIATYFERRTGASAVSLLATAGCQVLFVVGALISRYEDYLRAEYLRIPRILRFAIFLMAVLLYCDCLRLSSTFGPAAGATALIVSALCSSQIQNMLDRPIVQWLGRISYSLYLCHAVILLLLINVLYPRFTFLEIVLLCIPATLCIATLLYRWVEKPAISLSHAVARRWSQTRPPSGPNFQARSLPRSPNC